ncbi:hypothetical protein JRQ81_008876 [Phrynocephalus forsythii]|uniref:Protein phosphatase 1 regulatory subunit 26 N-terminal domain-containing protein n=1 Tax=Phrynocephalus forsythii TaxID=171643 RepID=A0A9Q0XAU2_9SAUR|nr:hypothetical protein JRQ81_008876 [Phrynocephalus forsythii]
MNRKVELSQKAERCQELQKGRNRAPPENSAVTSQVFSQAGLSAEKMCAEATLDISKFILSSPTGSDHRLFGTDHALGPQASQQERDSDAVDSDNSIDQEIRACLAIQAQRERSAAEPREAPSSARDPPTSSQLPMQARSLKRMSPKPLKLPLSPKRRRKGENRLSTPGPDGQPRQAETDWSCMDDAHSGTSASWPGKESPAPGASWYQEDLKATASSINVANPFSWGQLGTRNHAKKTTRKAQKYGPGDESSSLDSDEDLDTAIKDLLRSKLKQKEKNEDQRIQWMKQVRSGDMERMPVLEGKGGGSCRPEAACLLRGCPVGSGRDLTGGSAAKQSQSMAKRKLKDDRAVPVAYAFDNLVEPSSPREVWDFSKYPQSSWAAGSFPDDSSSDDGDDSIERGIRSFWAGKAKGSASSMETSGAHAIPETQEADKLWTSQMKARFSQVWKGQDGAPSQQKGSVKKGSPPIVGSRGSPRSETKAKEHASSPGGNHTVTSTEEAWSCAMVPLQRQQGPLFAPDVGVPARSTAAESRGLCLSELVQRDFPGEGVAQHHCTAQSHLPPLCPLRRQPVCEFSSSSRFMAGLESAPSEKRAVLWGKRQGVDAALFTSQGCGAAPELCWKRRGARAEEAEFAPSFGAEGLPACISERGVRGKVPPLCHERLNRAKGCPWAVEGADNPVNSNPGSPSEEPPADVRGVSIHTGVLKLEIPNEEERGKSPGCLVSGREGKVTYIPLDMLLREESGFDQGRAAAHQDPRALEESSGIYRQA